MTSPITYVYACTVFYSFLRVRVVLAADVREIDAPCLCSLDGVATPSQTGMIEPTEPPALSIVTVEALIDRNSFPAGYALCVKIGGVAHSIPMAEIVEMESKLHSRSLEPDFRNAITAHRLAHSVQPPRLLDIGGRARSGHQRSEDYPGCDVTVMDIKPDPGVDIVGDVHMLSRLAPANSFDFAISVAVFEHLLMPWKAAIEINQVLRPGALMLIYTHQTIGMHDLPWDFWRYSADAWPALFNTATGYKIEQTQMADFMHVVPANYYASQPLAEQAGGFRASSVLVRKVGPPQVSWPVDAAPLMKAAYPE